MEPSTSTVPRVDPDQEIRTPGLLVYKLDDAKHHFYKLIQPCTFPGTQADLTAARRTEGTCML